MTRPPRPRLLGLLAARRTAARTRALLAVTLSLALVTLTTGTVLVGLPAPSFASSTVSTGLSTGMSTGGTSGTSATVPIVTTATSPAQVQVVDYGGIASPDLPLNIGGHVTVTNGTSTEGLTATAYVIPGGVGSRADLAKLRADPTIVPKGKSYKAITTAVPVEGSAFTINQKANIDNKPLTIYAMKIVIASAAGKPLGAAYTFLVWAPRQPTAKAVSVTTVVPIADYPRLRSDGMLTDNDLATEIGPNGRLTRLLNAVNPTNGQQSPIALAVDPTLLLALKTMRDSQYRYASATGVKTAGKSNDAKTFLTKLSDFAAAPGNIVFPLPWGDADIAALVRAGGEQSSGRQDGGELNDALWAIDTGRKVFNEVLGTAKPPPVAYPGDGLADPATLAFLANKNVGVTTAILDDKLLPATPKSSVATPTALTVQRTDSGPIRALAADSTLGGLLSPKINTNDLSESQAFSQVLAELAMTTAENPGTTRNRLVIVALPRLWDPPTNDWAQLVLGYLSTQAPTSAGYQPFFEPEPLPVAPANGADNAQSAQGGASAFPTAGSARSEPVYPESAVATEIPTAYVDAVEHLRAEVRELDPVLCAVKSGDATTSNPGGPTDPGATGTAPCALTQSKGWPQDSRATVIQPMLRTLLTSLSVDWRPDRTGAVQLSQEVDGRINAIRGNVGIFATPKVTLTSRHGSVPLSVENISNQDLRGVNKFPMTVILSLSSNDRTRLQSPARISISLDPGTVNQLEVKVSSDAAGTFPVNVQVLAPNGQRLSNQPQPYRVLVRSTVYGAIATAITYVTIGLFAAAVVLRQVRRSRRKRRGGTGDGDGGSGGGPVDNLTPDAGLTGPNGLVPGDVPTTPVRRIQANAAGTQRMDVERAYAGGVPANPSEP